MKRFIALLPVIFAACMAISLMQLETPLYHEEPLRIEAVEHEELPGKWHAVVCGRKANGLQCFHTAGIQVWALNVDRALLKLIRKNLIYAAAKDKNGNYHVYL